MEMLKLIKRENNVCHKARKDRREGFVPGVIYGKEIGNSPIDIKYSDLEKQLHISGEHGIVEYDFAGKKGKAVIKEIQKAPVDHKVIHIDLEEIADNYKMHTEVPIKVEGKGLLLSKSLIFQEQKNLVKVVCTSKDLPKEIELDVTEGKPGTVYTLKDLKIVGNVEIDEELSSVIGSVSVEEREEEKEDSTEA